MAELKTFRFMHPSGKGFKLAVIAQNLRAARQYVRSHNSAVHNALKYVGEGHPTNPEGWTAAIVR